MKGNWVPMGQHYPIEGKKVLVQVAVPPFDIEIWKFWRHPTPPDSQVWTDQYSTWRSGDDASYWHPLTGPERQQHDNPI